MNNNLYAELAQLIQPPAHSPLFQRGKVLSVSPLKLELAGITPEGSFEKNEEIKELRSGDTVFVFSGDGQSFLILCKVVRT